MFQSQHTLEEWIIHLYPGGRLCPGKGPSTLSEDGEGWGRSCHPPWGEVFVLHNVPRTASRSSRPLPCWFISRSSMRLLFKVSPRSMWLWWWGRNSEAPFGSGSGQPFPSNTGLWYHLHSRIHLFGASLVVQMVKNPPAMQETRVLSVGQGDPLEKEMATHSSILWTEEPGGLQSTGVTRVRYNIATKPRFGGDST